MLKSLLKCVKKKVLRQGFLRRFKMKKKVIIWIIVILFLALVVYFFIDSLNVKPLGPPEVMIDLQCDALTAKEVCPEGYDCMKFGRLETPVCAQPNPCSYYKCSGPFNDCVMMESYPMQIACR